MNAYEMSQSLGLSGTDAEIVNILKSTGITATKIALGNLLYTLNKRKMLVRLVRPTDTGEKWSGSVIYMILYVNEYGSSDQKVAINEWFSHITNDRNEYFDTTDPTVGGAFLQMAQNFGGVPNMPSAEDFQAIADLGGGWLYSALTEEQFVAQRASAEALAVKQELREYLEALEATFDRLKNIALLGINSGELTTHEALVAAVLVEGA